MKNLDLSRVILGCGGFGGVGSLPELYGKGESREMAHDLLDQASELGMTRFDTANTYGGGLSESILGEWIQKRSPAVRQRFRISTKVGNPFGCPSDDRPLSRRQIQFHLERSLQRLGIDQVDVYYLHEPDPRTPLEETLEALSRALQKGLIAGFGLSNVGLDHVQRLLKVAGEGLAGKLTHIQNEFHYLNTLDQDKLIPFLAQNNIRYVAFGPLAGGLLSGKYERPDSPTHLLPQGSRLSLRPEPYQRFLTPEGLEKLSHFAKQAQLAGKKPAEEALRYVLNAPGVDSVIIGPRKKEHYESLGLKFKRA